MYQDRELIEVKPSFIKRVRESLSKDQYTNMIDGYGITSHLAIIYYLINLLQRHNVEFWRQNNPHVTHVYHSTFFQALQSLKGDMDIDELLPSIQENLSSALKEYQSDFKTLKLEASDVLAYARESLRDH